MKRKCLRIDSLKLDLNKNGSLRDCVKTRISQLILKKTCSYERVFCFYIRIDFFGKRLRYLNAANSAGIPSRFIIRFKL
jgi:hypothetical protein